MNPILLDFPDQFETERLIIRAPRPGDGAAMNRAICESLTELAEWMPWAQQAPTRDESEANIREACAKWQNRTDLRLLLFNRSGEFVGGSGLHRIDWAVPRFEIGYWLRTSFYGQGLMTEAARGIADFAFRELKARRVEIRCASGNIKSAAVARRAGFAHEATLHNWGRNLNGKLHDELVFALTRNEEE